ncbi:hypothetical protein LBMAG20_13730 [Methylocystaceae bacterium]|nr:hypothetical protein LBMAG20_13730 [Methylocystaceae bacterium]
MQLKFSDARLSDNFIETVRGWVMAGCEGLTFHGVNRAAWSAIKHAAGAYGISGGDSGQASRQGFSFSWSYHESSKTLHLQCIDGPELVPCSEINARLRAEVQQVIVATNDADGGTIIA